MPLRSGGQVPLVRRNGNLSQTVTVSPSGRPRAVLLCSQGLGRIDAVSAPKELREPARVAKAVMGGNLRHRKCAVSAQQLRPGLFEPDVAQSRHRRRAAKAMKRRLQSANTTLCGLRDLEDGQWRAGIGAHEFLRSAYIAGRGGRTLLLQSLCVDVRQAEQEAERQIILESPCRDLVG